MNQLARYTDYTPEDDPMDKPDERTPAPLFHMLCALLYSQFDIVFTPEGLARLNQEVGTFAEQPRGEGRVALRVPVDPSAEVPQPGHEGYYAEMDYDLATNDEGLSLESRSRLFFPYREPATPGPNSHFKGSHLIVMHVSELNWQQFEAYSQ